MKFITLLIAFLIQSRPTSLFGQALGSDPEKPSNFTTFCKDRNDSIEKPVHLEWIKHDKDIINDKLNKLPSIGNSMEKLLSVVPHFSDKKCNCSGSTYNLGYGLKSTEHIVYGGYGHATISAIYFGNFIIQLRLTINYPNEIINNYLFNELKLPFECVNGQVQYDTLYQSNLTRYITDSGRIFIQSADTNQRRKQAINYFATIQTGSIFQEPFYIKSSLGSETLDHLRYFIVNKDYKALEDILFSPSPTGRLFAARTLLYMKNKYGYNAATAIRKRMQETLENAPIIKSGILSCWVGRFDHDYYNIVKDFDNYLQTK